MLQHSFKRMAAATALAATIALPGATAFAQNDASDGYQGVQPQAVDMRAPDQVNPAPSASAPVVALESQPQGEGFDLGDAGIGAAGAVGFVAIAGGLSLLVVHRRRDAGVTA